jgi:hypothetical protein
MHKIIYTSLISITLIFSSLANAENHSQHHQMLHSEDNRISLNLPPNMKLHQLKNMRAHVVAVQSIIELIAKQDFQQASKVATEQLGLTARMDKMCKKFANEDFKQLGLAFHQSGDELADVLLTKDTTASLQALSKTMNYCIQCHATYRQ